MYEDSYYEPTEEEQKELDELMKFEREEENAAILKKKIADRKIFEFHTESHWSGWLKIHGMIW